MKAITYYAGNVATRAAIPPELLPLIEKLVAALILCLARRHPGPAEAVTYLATEKPARLYRLALREARRQQRKLTRDQQNDVADAVVQEARMASAAVIGRVYREVTK